MNRQRHRWGVVTLWTGVFGVLAAGAAVAQQEPADVETPPEVTIQQTPPGPMFADVDGYTLYVSERDVQPGQSSCDDKCMSEWIPMRASVDANSFGEWTLVPRDDGAPQWAYRERPLYRWAKETQRRWADGQNQTWRYALVSPFPTRAARRGFGRSRPQPVQISLPPDLPGGITGQPSALGPVFADGKGRTLYTATASTPCAGPCLETWKPFPAPLLAIDPAGDWTIVKRPDGTHQWAYDSKPLYWSVKDINEGDTNGVTDEWHALLVPGVTASAPAP